MSFDRRTHAEVLDATENTPLRRTPTLPAPVLASPAKTACPPRQKDAVLESYAFAEGSKLARTFARAVLEMWDWAGDHDSVLLVIAELFSNAVAATPECPVWVRVAWDPEGVLCEVWDQSRLTPPASRLPEVDAENGRGNFVIGALTLRHGSTVTELLNGGGKVVWGLVPTTPKSQAWEQ
jgi:hypothetical protein